MVFLKDTDLEVFFQNKLFASLGDDRLLKNAEIINAKKGERLMSKKHFSRCLALIIRGEASVSKKSPDGRKIIMNRLVRGDVFGMATLFYEEAEFPSEITAETSLRLAVFSKDEIEKAFASCPDFAKAYATLLSEKIHFLNRKISAFSEGEAAEKLLRWIETASAGESEFILPCSVSKLALMLGIGRASVYRGFDALSERGIIRKEGKKITILN